MTLRLPARAALGAASAATLTAVALAPSARAAQGDTALKVVPSGATRQLGGYAPQRLALSADKPASVKKVPGGLSAPRYGVLNFGPASAARAIVFLLDEPAGADARLFVDANSNGDLTDDPKAEWVKAPYAGGQPYSMYRGAAQVPLTVGGRATPVSLSLYRFDPTDPQRQVQKDFLLYYRDYALTGMLNLGGKTYPVTLDDRAAKGDFGDPAAVDVLLDVNANGRIDSRGERFTLAKPFNVGGTTYDASAVTAGEGGVALRLAKSAQTVAEVTAPPNLNPGKPAPTFAVTTTDGVKRSFPADYKGKLVLLDFWATWCGPCIAELPTLTRVASTYQSKGLEVLGVSLDRENWAEKLAAFTKEKNMPWPQVYDGKYWEAEISRLYGVSGIPAAFLVDGDTGQIVASGNDLRGEKLEATVQAALAKKKAR